MIIYLLISLGISILEFIATIAAGIGYGCLEKSIKNVKQDVVGILFLVLSALLNFFMLKNEVFSLLMVLGFCFTYTVLQIIAIIDLKIQTIPNLILIIGMALKAVLLVGELIFSRETFLSSLVSSGIGFVVCLLVMLLISFVSKKGIGYGDVKLMAYLGFSIGLLDTYYVLFYAILFAAIFAAYTVLIKKKDKKTKIPFGPFVYLGFVVVYLFTFI